MKKIVSCFLAALLCFSLCCAMAEETVTVVYFSGQTADVIGGGAAFANGKLSITADGTYELSGEGSGIQISITANKNVTLVLKGLTLSNDSGPAVLADVKHLTIRAAEGTSNVLRDDEVRLASASSEVVSKALIFASDDLNFEGTGSLSLTSLLGHAAHCKDEMSVENIKLVINAANDGLHANDGFGMNSGYVTITSGGDGIQTTNAKEDKGGVDLFGGTLLIHAQKSPIDAVGTITIEDACVTIYPADAQ